MCASLVLDAPPPRVPAPPLPQRFKFRPAFPETGRIDSKMIPIGAAGGLHMFVE
jgi:hypothetical protein